MAQKEQSINLELATFGNGCFWCTEAIFQKLRGVESVVSGYAGGDIPNPSYEDVSSGATGHAEVLQIKFNPQIIPYSALLDIFWHTHNPTTPNRQGADVGSQYRSVIFYHNQTQKSQAESSKKALQVAGAFNGAPIVTQIVALDVFYPAEDYHQDYFNSNPDAPYCQLVIEPKIKKLITNYGSLIK